MNEQIFSILSDKWKKIQEAYPNNQLIYLAVYGSQNYQMDLPSSDIDTYAVMAPSMDDLVSNHAISAEHHFSNGEHCVVKDIRLYIDQLKKQSFNVLETLSTPYFMINPEFTRLLQGLRLNVDTIARYDPYRFCMAALGNFHNSNKRLSTLGFCELKQIAMMMLIVNIVDAYIHDTPFSSCLTSEIDYSHEVLMKTKQGLVTNEDLMSIMQQIRSTKMIETIRSSIEGYCEQIDKVKQVQMQNRMNLLFKGICAEIIRTSVQRSSN